MKKKVGETNVLNHWIYDVLRGNGTHPKRRSAPWPRKRLTGTATAAALRYGDLIFDG